KAEDDNGSVLPRSGFLTRADNVPARRTGARTAGCGKIIGGVSLGLRRSGRRTRVRLLLLFLRFGLARRFRDVLGSRARRTTEHGCANCHSDKRKESFGEHTLASLGKRHRPA